MIEPKKNVKILNRMKDFGSDRSAFVRLDKNERTVPFLEKDFKKMIRAVSSDLLSMYPDQTSLYQRLEKFYGLEAKYFLLTPGSDAALKMIYETYIYPGDKVLFFDPTYAMIEVYADLFEAKKIKIGYGKDLAFDFDLLLKAITPAVKMVMLANPNQPTGTILNQTQIRKLLEKTRLANTLLVLDEAYQPFSGQPSAMSFVAKNPHLMVVQTFSKAFGMASIRLGFVVSQPQNLNYLYRVKTYSDINLFAIRFGEYLLDHRTIVKKYVRDIQTSKQWLKRSLEKYGYACIEGYANFIHIKFPDSVRLESITESLKRKGYLVRIAGVGMPAVLEGCMRITLGPLPQMKKFLVALQDEIRKAEAAA